jgi:protease-4
MKALVAKILITVGGITVVLLLVAGGLLVYFWVTGKAIPKKTILEADFEKNYVEYIPEDRLGSLMMRKAPLVRDVVAALDKASEDPKVAMLVAKVGASKMQLAKIQEIRDAVIKFRKKGKKAIAYAETFGEFGPGNGAYYLSTAFDRIYLQPSGEIGLTGLSMKTPFLKDLLKKVGIEPRLAHRKEYKSAAYTFTEKKYIEPHREADRAVLESMISQIVDGIAGSRGMTREAVVSLIDRGPFSAKEALQEKLVDELAYRDQVYDEAKKEAGKGSDLLLLSEYLKRAGSPYSGKKKIALIYGVGQIIRGKSRYTPLGRHIMGSETVAEAFRQAVKDKSVEAIVFRINSPGGSYAASDVVWRETVRAKQEGKPVVASMSEVAGSGGYFVAMEADKIIAHPGTITGSIGVVSGKMVTSDMWDKIGVHWGELFTHENASLWSSTENYSSEQWEHIQTWLDRVYEDFVTKVAQGRNLDIEKVRRIAKGRIWSGKTAKELGLVDELGGLGEALRAAKALAKIPEDEKVGIKVFPAKRPLWKRLVYGRPKSSDIQDAVRAEVLGQWMELARETGFFEPVGALQMKEPKIE